MNFGFYDICRIKNEPIIAQKWEGGMEVYYCKIPTLYMKRYYII